MIKNKKKCFNIHVFSYYMHLVVFVCESWSQGMQDVIKCVCFFCLFDLMLYVPVNGNGHVGTLPPFYGTFTQN